MSPTVQSAATSLMLIRATTAKTRVSTRAGSARATPRGWTNICGIGKARSAPLALRSETASASVLASVLGKVVSDGRLASVRSP